MATTQQCSSRKRHKASKEEQNSTPRIDRLSDLPDSVLCHVLSFLSTKLAVATSVLSRRWRLVWTNVPCVDFGLDDYLKIPEYKMMFSDIIYKVIMLNNAQVWGTFRLHYEEMEYCNEYQLQTWLNVAIARKVRVLDLYLPCRVALPRCLFDCKTLVRLSLDRCVEVPWPSVMCFPSLKRLDLIEVEYGFDGNLSRLISGCPVLEELFIHRILPNDLLFCNVSSPTIQNLTILFLHAYDEQEPYHHDFRLELNTPALRNLTVEDDLSEHISAHMLTSLAEAHIIFGNENLKLDAVAHSGYVMGFVDKLCNVERLMLSVRCTKYIESAFSASTVRFHYLTKLELCAHFGYLYKFLVNADNLQELIIRSFGEHANYWMEPQQVPVCLLSNVTTIRIEGFSYSDEEFEVVRYLLGSSRVLKMMEIYTNKDHEDKELSGLKRISMFQRGSAACQVAWNRSE